MDEFLKQTGFTEDRLTQIGVSLIERSRETARDSDHHRYHVGSSLLSITKNGEEHFTDNANRIPYSIKDKGYNSHNTIGAGSPTVHGEFPLLYKAPPSKHLFLGCNTPNCANCLKSAIMRGVDAIFIDAESLPGMKGPRDAQNPWTQDRAHLWNDLCLPIASAARMPVYAVNTQSGALSILVNGAPPDQRPRPEKPARILNETEVAQIEHHPDLFLSGVRGQRCAIGVARSKKNGTPHFIYAEDCLPPGFSETQGIEMTDKFKNAHYHFPLDPITHMCMEASRHNLELQDGKILANFVPTSGRQLDLAYIGISHMLFTDHHVPATEETLQAIHDLSALGVMTYATVKPERAISQMINTLFRDIDKTITPHGKSDTA